MCLSHNRIHIVFTSLLFAGEDAGEPSDLENHDSMCADVKCIRHGALLYLFIMLTPMSCPVLLDLALAN